jgi:hypothetical protein
LNLGLVHARTEAVLSHKQHGISFVSMRAESSE